MDSIEMNIRQILQNIKNAEMRCAKPLEEPVRLIAVTKNHGPEAVDAAAAAGVTLVGENRVQEAKDKKGQTAAAVAWHLIGHLQTNKARQAVALFDLIQSVDSWHLAEALNKAACAQDKRQDILLQVNVANEETKFGLRAEDTLDVARRVAELPGLRLCGLMTIAPYVENAELVRPYFKEMRRLFGELKTLALPGVDCHWLSMGMTNDYQVAVEEGANLVRVGTGIFGPRSYGVQGGL